MAQWGSWKATRPEEQHTDFQAKQSLSNKEHHKQTQVQNDLERQGGAAAELVQCQPTIHEAKSWIPWHCINQPGMSSKHWGGRRRRIRSSKPAWTA